MSDMEKRECADSPSDRERVSCKIAGLILTFYDARRTRPVFFSDELRQFVSAELPVAPASPDRILRLLRKAGLLDYKVTDRSQSEYTFIYQDGA